MVAGVSFWAVRSFLIVGAPARSLHRNPSAILAVDPMTLFASARSEQPMIPIVPLTVFALRAILRPMRVLSVIVLLTALILPAVAFAEVQTLTATHTYILGDHGSKDDV